MGVAVGDYDRDGTHGHLQDQLRRRHLHAVRQYRQRALRGSHLRQRHRPQHALARMGRRVPGSRSRRLAGPVPRQRPRLSRGRPGQDRGGLQAAQSRLPQPRRRPVRRRHRAARTAGDGRPRPAAARPLPISTTTATSTSLVNNVHDAPELYRLDQREPRTGRRSGWSASQSNRSAIGARVRVHGRRRRRCSEVRGGGSYYSQNDLRLHFGLGATKPSSASRCAGRTALEESWTGVEPSIASYTLKEGTGRPLPASDSAVSDRASVDPAAGAGACRRARVTCSREARELIDDGQAAEGDRDAAVGEPTATPTQAEVGLLLGVAYYHADDTGEAIELLAPVVRSTARGFDRAPRSGPGPRPRALSSPADSPRRFRCSRRRGGGRRTTWSSAYVLGQAYVQTRQPDAARPTVASHLWRGARFGGRAPARGAADDSAGDGAAGGGRADAGARARIRGCRRANYLLGQIALFRGRLAEAIALTHARARDQPGRRDGVLAARRRLRARQSKWDEAIAALQKSIWLNPVLQRARTSCSAGPT